MYNPNVYITGDHMIRTQIYLTEPERRGINAIAKSSGKKQSEIIRQAVDQFLDYSLGSQRSEILSAAAGIWKDRHDLPDPGSIRESWDR